MEELTMHAFAFCKKLYIPKVKGQEKSTPFSRLKPVALLFLFYSLSIYVQAQSNTADSMQVETLRKESGVDPTRVASRVAYSLLYYDRKNNQGQVNNRAGLTLGIDRWSIAMKYEVIAKTGAQPGSGFEAGMGDIKFSLLNAFYVKGKSALAASAEFSIPTGKEGFGSQYFSVTPALTYSYTINPTLFVAVQPQYTFHLLKDELYPDLSVLTIRSFLAKFTKTGYFFVLELRPVLDFGNSTNDLIISPIMGKSLGSGFNLIFLAEFPTNGSTVENRGNLYQLGFNKNF